MRFIGLLVVLVVYSKGFTQAYYKLDTALERGYNLYYQGKYDEAGHAYFNALKRAQETGNKKVEAEAYRLLGEVNRASSNRPYAIKYLDKAEALFSSIHDEYGVASTKNRKAAAYFELGDSLNYSKYLASSLKISRDNGFKDIEYNSLTILGAVQFVKALDYREAIHTLQRAFSIAKELNKVEDYPYIYNNLSRLYQEMGNLDSAEIYGQKALKIGEEFNIRTYISSACGRLSLIYAGKKEWEKAFEYERRFTQFRDTLEDEGRDKVIAELVENYQTEKQQEALQRQKAQIQYTSLALAVLLILLVVITIMFFNLRKQRKQLRDVNARIGQQNDSLEEMNDLKDRLLSVLSHDLRSPVAALHSSLEILTTEEVPQAIQNQLLSELRERTDQTAQLLDNLLIWIKSQLEGLSLHKSEVNLSHLVSEVVNTMKHDLERKQLQLKMELDEKIKLEADPELVRIIIRNLASNAYKYSNPGTNIEIRLTQEKNEILLEIQDHGVGMSSSSLKNLFKLNKKSKSGTSNEKGVGIGMVLVKDLVNKSGGRITAESEAEIGTIVRVYFPN
ncbi:MAG: tetratricopeptide repeat protein [Bacteroidetes bacterium]|nr:tetratricopeptide repeat protein [Bacteroidota bacterium]